MSNNYAKTLAAIISKAKLAAEMPPEVEAAHEAAESPEQEAMEHQPGQYEEGGEENPETSTHEGLESAPQEGLEQALGEGEGAGEEHIDQLLSQLSPEEIEQLAAELSGEMQSPAAQGGNEDVGELAQAIESHLSQNPEAALEGVAPEKAAALAFVKSASYIEGFINQAVDRGVSVKQAVDMYDQALTSTINSLKTAELKGNQHKLDVDHDGKIEASDLAKLRASKNKKTAELKGNQHKLDVDHDGKIEASDLAKLRAGKKQKTAFELNEEIKTAAYYEGVIERAREYGFSDHEAVHFVKSAFMTNPNATRKPAAKQPKTELDKAIVKSRIFAKKNKGKLGLAAGALAAYGLADKKD